MSTPEAFRGLDVGWLATDAIGQVALFITAGMGPVPESALASIEDGEEQVLALPQIGGVNWRAQADYSDAFAVFAKRGLFSYDWSDIHRCACNALNAYELKCDPQTPLTLLDLPEPLQVLAQATRFTDITFGVATLIPHDQVDAHSAGRK